MNGSHPFESYDQSSGVSASGFDSIVAQHHGSATGFSRHYLTLYSLVMGMECLSVFEFGAGHSTKAILAALQFSGGYLVSCDVRPVKDIVPLGVGFDHTYWDRWIFLQGNSRQITNNLSCEFGPYDLVLHDGSHHPDEVIGDLRDIVPQMRKDSLLLVHDTEHPDIDYGLSRAVEEALAPFRHSRVRLPFGYGLDVVRIEEDFGHPPLSLKWRKQKQKQVGTAIADRCSEGQSDGSAISLAG